MLKPLSFTVCLWMALTLTAAFAQDAYTAKLQPSGVIQISKGERTLALIDLNAHGPQWKHAPQGSGTALVSTLPDGSKRFVGILPIPNTEAGSLKYTETIKPLPQGVQVEYELSVAKTMKLNGLQLSVNLPLAQHAGKMVQVTQPEGTWQVVTIPTDQNFWGFSGEGFRVETDKGTPDAMTVELRAAADISMQDLRKWGSDLFEIRFPAISDDAGQEVLAEDRFHLDVTIKLPGPVKVVGP